MLKIKTNNQPRLLLDWDQLTPKEQAEFTYLSEDDRIGRDFIRYRGWCYDVGEFTQCSDLHEFPPEWQGYASNSFFSGVLVRYTKDGDRVIMATYFS